VREVPYVQRNVLDWLIPPRTEYQDLKIGFTWSGLNFQDFGEMTNNKVLNGRGLRVYDAGVIYVGYHNNGERAPGFYANIYGSGKYHVGENYFEGAD
jgi:hypothetical protein